MSAFFVGQRVKKVRGCRENIGLTGRVVAVDLPHPFSPTHSLHVRVDGHAHGTVVDYRPGDVGASDPREWEPILAEGMKPARWEDCIWKPEGVSA